MTRNLISIAIPAYKSPDRLRRCLRAVEAIDAGWLTDVVVVDDSGDGQVVDALKSEFPTVTWITHDTNQGFARAANDAVAGCATDWVILLNDDSELASDPRPRVKHLLLDNTLFAVSFQSVNEHGEHREGAKRLAWRFGIAKILHNPQDQLPLISGESDTSYAVGGHALFRRKAYLELGGFDSGYHPFYWEDVDLSQRARDSGLQVRFVSNVTVLHRADGAIRSTQSTDLIRLATWRNRLRFSRRHSRGIHRVLFPFGVMWHKLHAQVSGDEVKSCAISEFQEMASSKYEDDNGATALAE